MWASFPATRDPAFRALAVSPGCSPRFWLNTGPACSFFSAEAGRPPDKFSFFFVYMNVDLVLGAALNTALTPMAIKYAAHCTAVLLVVAVGGEGGRRKHLYNKDTYIQSSR